MFNKFLLMRYNMSEGRRQFMNYAGKTAGSILLFFFALVFIPVIYAEPLPGDEISSVPKTPSAEEPAIANSAVNEENFNDDDLFYFEAPTLVFEAAPVEIRSLINLFPGLSRNQLLRARSDTGLRYAFEKNEAPTLIPNPDYGIDLYDKVMGKKPSHIVEALIVVPYMKRELDLLDIYNALGRIKNIKDHKIISYNREIIIFSDTTRLKSAKERKPIPDPAPVEILPYAETMYLRFIDPYIGDFYLRGEISVSLYGLTYTMTNFRDVSYYIFKVMKSERFSAIIYLEPVKEGLLIYSVSGLYLPNFIAKKINITPNMNRRITVLLDWITEGLRIQEEIRQDTRFYRLMPK